MIVIVIATGIGMVIVFITGFWAGRLTERFAQKRRFNLNQKGDSDEQHQDR